MSRLRIVTWNCRIGAFRRKAQHVAPLRPDVLAVQELEPIDNVLLFAGECQPSYRDRIRERGRGLGMFSYTETELRAVDPNEPMTGFRCYEARRGELAFHVVAVWTYPAKPRERAYMQAHEGISRHADWIRQRPTIILGDFNNNGSFKWDGWKKLLDLLRPLGLPEPFEFGRGRLGT